MRRADEEGFTLVEMVVVVVILGLISSALLTAFVQGLNLTASAGTSLGSSHDTQLTDYYLERDALGSTVSYPGSSTAPTWACATGAGVTVGTGPPDEGVVQFNWSQAEVYAGSSLPSGEPSFTPGADYEADYVYEGTKLVRYNCTLTGTGTSAGTHSITVASSLSRTQAPVAAQSSSPSCGGTQSGTCTSVNVVDATGQQYTVILLDRSFGQ